MLSISPEKVFFIIVKAREFAAKDAVTDPDPSSSGADDHMISVLEDHADDPSFDEAREFIAALSEDERIDLVTLAWLGRGDYTADDWDEVRGEAADAHNERTAEYLLGMPLLADYLQEGLELLDIQLDEFEIGRL
jgi:hypothetical protein